MEPHYTAPDAAARLGVDPRTLRRKAELGLIPGAFRTGYRTGRGEWRIPVAYVDGPPETKKAPAVAGASSDQATPSPATLEPDVTSSPGTAIHRALRVYDLVAPVRTTRPSRALVASAEALATVAELHRPDRDGRCQECGSTCRTFDLVDGALDLVVALLETGRAS